MSVRTLKRLLESLERCKYADKTEVYIAVDFPAKESHVDGHSKIVSYLRNKKFIFKETHIYYRDHNCGFGKNGNCNLLLKEIFRKYDRYIFTEDDNEFAPSFLEYININLEKYKDDPTVFSVCGYMFKDIIPDRRYTQLNMPIYCAWGVGFWVDKRNDFGLYFEDKKLSEIIDDPKVVNFFSKRRKSIYIALLRMRESGQRLGDIIVSGYLIHKDMQCVFPMVSLVRNWGWDGTGTHGGSVEGYNSQSINENENFDIIIAPESVSKSICDQQYDNWAKSESLSNKLQTAYSWFVYKITGEYYSLNGLKILLKKLQKPIKR